MVTATTASTVRASNRRTQCAAAGVRDVVVVPGVVTVPGAPGRRHVDSLIDLDLAVLGT